jgi:hypothetical protein
LVRNSGLDFGRVLNEDEYDGKRSPLENSAISEGKIVCKIRRGEINRVFKSNQIKSNQILFIFVSLLQFV